MSRAYHFIALLFCGLLLAAHISWLDEPWDSSLAGVNGGAYYGYACQGLDMHGFFEKKMQGPEFFHHENPELWRPYANHPGTGYFLFYPCYRYFGKDEAALKSSMLIVCAFLLYFFWWSLSRVATKELASAATIVFASLPLLYQYGDMVDISVFCLALSIPTLASWRLWRDQRRSYFLYFAWAFAAGSMDWFSYFMVPAIWLIDLFETGSLKERLRRAFIIGLPFGLSLMVVGTWLIWAKGGLDAFLAQLELMFKAVSGQGMETQSEIHKALSSDTPELWPSVRRYVVNTNTIAVLVMAGLGLLRAIATRFRDPLAKIALAGLVAGILPALVFPTHAAKHEFWFIMTGGGVALFSVGSLLGFGKVMKPSAAWLRLGSLILITALAGQAAWNGKELHDSYRTTLLRDRGLDLAKHLGPRDLVFSSLGLAADRFYLDAVMVPGIRNRAAYDELRGLLKDQGDSFDRVFILWWEGQTEDTKWITKLKLVDPKNYGKVITCAGLNFGLIEVDAEDYFHGD